MQKKILLFLISFLLVFPLSACGESQPTISKDGEMMFLDKETIEEEGREGFYVLNRDKTFTPLMNAADGYQGETTEKDNLSQRYLWFTNNELHISSLIPTVSAGTPLVAVYNTDDAMPALYTIEKYNFLGYTIGCHVFKEEDDTLYLQTADPLSSSMAASELSEISEQEYYQISKINGSEKLPAGNVDNNMRLLLGLEKGKYYDFEFFKGTHYINTTLVADTFVLQSEDVKILNNPYTKTTKGYFLINLPDNLKPGYYYICGAGLFKYAS